MKKLIYLVVILGVVGFLSSCNTPSKAGTWSSQQEQTWKTACMGLLTGNGVDKPTAEDRCDCIFEKTSEKYTPEETEHITVEKEREIWEECDYSW